MESSALIYAYVLDGPNKGQALDLQQVQHLDVPEHTTWLHFDYSHPDTRNWLRECEWVDNLVAKSLISEETRPRASQIEQGLVVALRGVNLNPESCPEDMVSIRLWVTDKLIISARKRRLLSTSDMAEQIASGKGPETTGQFLAMLAERLISRMQSVVYDIEDKVSEIEELTQTQDPQSLRHQIADLRRQSIALRRYLRPQNEAMNVLQNNEAGLFSDDDLSHLRETMNHLVRYLEELESIKDRAAVTQEELAGAVNEQLNSRMYVLSIVAALFLPLGFLTGLLGINVGGIPGAENPDSFWIFCAFLSVLIGAQVVIFKWRRWF